MDEYILFHGDESTQLKKTDRTATKSSDSYFCTQLLLLSGLRISKKKTIIPHHSHHYRHHRSNTRISKTVQISPLATGNFSITSHREMGVNVSHILRNAQEHKLKVKIMSLPYPSTSFVQEVYLHDSRSGRPPPNWRLVHVLRLGFLLGIRRDRSFLQPPSNQGNASAFKLLPNEW